MRIGVFGGTFDPPHYAHLVLAAEAHDQLRLEKVLWVLTPQPPHKPYRVITDLPIRLKLLQAAIKGEAAFKLSRVDVDRPQPHYAVDTMRLLSEQFPDGELVYLIGADSLRDLPGWHRPADLVEACHEIGVMPRPGAQYDLSALGEIMPGLVEKLRFVDAPLLEISSSDIRQRVQQGRMYRYFVPEGVWRIVQDEGLYLDQSDRH